MDDKFHHISGDFPEPEDKHWVGEAGGFSKIPSIFFQLHKIFPLTAGEQLLMLFLAHHTHNNQKPTFSLSFPEIRKLTGLSNGSVNNGILKLLQVGVLQQVIRLSPNSKNEYRWNDQILSGGMKNAFQNLERARSKNWKGGFPKNGMLPFQNLERLYIEFFLYILYISFIGFFAERDDENKPATMTVRALPSRRKHNVGEDSPEQPKTKKVPRLDAWRLALTSVLRTGSPNRYAHVYSIISLSGDLDKVRWPKRHLGLLLASGEKYREMKAWKESPAWLEDDELFFSYLHKSDSLFQDFKEKGGEEWLTKINSGLAMHLRKKVKGGIDEAQV